MIFITDGIKNSDRVDHSGTSGNERLAEISRDAYTKEGHQTLFKLKATENVHLDPDNQHYQHLPRVELINSPSEKSPSNHQQSAHASETLKITKGPQSLDDLKALGTGIAKGVGHIAQETLNHLSTPGAVNGSVRQVGTELNTAAHYYTTTPPDQMASDAQIASSYVGKAVVDNLGHPLTQEKIGEMAGELMTVFTPIGANKALNAKEMEALGGVQKLEQMNPAELEALGLKRYEAGGDWPVINEHPSADVVQQTNKLSCVAACGEMLSEGKIEQARLINKISSPAAPEWLAKELGPDWKSGYVGPHDLDHLLQQVPWVAELRSSVNDMNKFQLGHLVVVDGINDIGNVTIRDPWNGTKYEMTQENFLAAWTGRVVFKQ